MIVSRGSGSRSEKRRHAIICTVNAFCRGSIHIGIINNGVRLCPNTPRPNLLDYVKFDFLSVSLSLLFAVHCVVEVIGENVAVSDVFNLEFMLVKL